MARKKSFVANFVAAMDWQTLAGDDTANIMTSTYNGTTLEGLGGNDTLTTTLVGPDVSANLSAYQYGGAGIDTMNLKISGAMRYAGAVLDGGGGNDTITANVVDTSGMPYDWNHLAEVYLLGGGGDDFIKATAYVYTGHSVVEAYGGVGNDTIELSGGGKYGSVSLYAEGGAGDDIIIARSQNYDSKPNVTIELYGGDGNDQLTAETSQGFYPSIALYGGAGDDILTAREQMGYAAWNAGKSELYGGSGDDVLRGSVSFDLMHGGADADRFEIGPGVRDTILDFNLAEGDRLMLTQGAVTGAVVSGGDMIVSFTGGSVLLTGVTELDLSLAFA